MPFPSLARPRALAVLATTVVALSLVALPAIGLADAPTAAAANPVACLPGVDAYPNLSALSGGLQGTDPDIGVYINGDLAFTPGTAEAEGSLMVTGSASFDTGSYFNLGVVGIGSQVVPAALSDMLTAGGEVTVGTTTSLDVGTTLGGNIRAGATVGPTSKITLSGGAIIPDATAGSLYSTTAARFAAQSAFYAPLEPTGVVESLPGVVSFLGDGVSNRQVFTVDGASLGSNSSGGTASMVFTAIPTDAIIVINVTGQTAVVSANTFSVNGTLIQDPYADPFSSTTRSILWNFPTATDVTLGYGDQLLGSILVPTANSSVTISTSINGRLFVNGDVTMGGPSGLEIHNYPFRSEISCGTTGSLVVAKALTDPDGIVPGDRLFTGNYSCSLDATVVASGRWSQAGNTTSAPVTGIPTGAVCTVTEDALSAGPSPTDASYRWSIPTYSSPTVTIAADAIATVTVTNTVSRALGDLEMVKILDDPYNVVGLDRVYTGTWGCTLDGARVESGTWSTTAGAAALRLASDLPAGVVCTLAEDASTLAAPPLAGFPQYVWLTPEIEPSTVTITENTVSRFTVTNVVYDPIDSPQPPSTPASPQLNALAQTGIDPVLPVMAGAGALGVGVLFLSFGYRRRVASGSGRP